MRSSSFVVHNLSSETCDNYLAAYIKKEISLFAEVAYGSLFFTLILF